jgi:hypothetical protein
MYSHLTEIEADYQRDRVIEQFRSARRRHRRLLHRHDDRRWQNRRARRV